MEAQQEIMRVTVRMEGKAKWYFEGNDFVTSGQKRLKCHIEHQGCKPWSPELEVSECGRELV